MNQVEKYIQELEEYDSNAAEVLKQYSPSFDSEKSYKGFVMLVHKCFQEAKEIGEFIEQTSNLMLDTEKASFYKEQYDKYLDDAYLSHMESVRIVHGKGTGALRSAVQSHLKKLSYVKSYRAGEHGEGDAGVTIVTFK